MDFENSQYYTNRELSWIQFNYRVLEEARDKSNPLFERLKFLSITSSNLDEFFMVRVASLKDMVNAGYKKPDIAGMTPKEQLSAISEALHEFTQTQYSTYNRSLLPLLAKEHITVLTSFEQMNDEEASFADNFFMEKVYPVLTPMAVDASRPFPLIRNKSLNIAALIKTKNQSEEEMEPELEFATVQVPSVMGRIVQLPCTEGVKLILLEEIIRRNISKLFLNYDVISTAAYRIERNADLSIDEEEAEDLLQEIEKQLKQRQWGEAIKLEVSEEIDKYLLKYLKKELAISDEEIYKIQGPLDLTFLMKLYGMEGFDAFKQPKYKPQRCPQIDPELSIFDNIKKGDIFLHHPLCLCHMSGIPLIVHLYTYSIKPIGLSPAARWNHTFPIILSFFTAPILPDLLSSLLLMLSPRVKYSLFPRVMGFSVIPASSILSYSTSLYKRPLTYKEPFLICTVSPGRAITRFT